MRSRSRSWLAVGVAMTLVGTAGCHTTHVSTVWKSPDPPPTAPFQTVAMIVVNATPAERRAAEDQLATEARLSRGVASYTFLPDEDLQSPEKNWSALERNGIDGAVVVRLTSVDKHTTYTPPTYFYSSDPFGRYAYPTYTGYAPEYIPGRTTTTVTVHAEISLYAVAGRRLLWAGSSWTEDPSGVRDMMHQVAAAARDELGKQRLLPATAR